MFWNRTKIQEPTPVKQFALNSSATRRMEDRLVLEHVVGYIKRACDEGRKGFHYSADMLEDLAQTLPQDSDARNRILDEVLLLRHMADRLEYIDAHKIKEWDEMAYRKFIMTYGPKINEDDE